MAYETPHEVELRLAHDRNELGETLSVIQYRLSPDHVADQAWNFLRDNGGDMAMQLGRAVKANPIPLALTGIGLAWLIGSTVSSRSGRKERGGRNSYSSKAYGNSTYDYYEGYGEYEASSQRDRDPVSGYGPLGDSDDEAEQHKTSLLQRARAAADSLRQSGSETSDAFNERIAQAKAQVLNVQRRAGENLADFNRRIDETMTNLSSSAKQRFQDASRQATDIARRASRQAGELRERTTTAFRDQPLLAVAVGIGVGALLGALTPISRREQEMLAPYGEKARERMRSAAEDLGERAQTAAAEAAQAAVHTLDDGARETAQTH